MRMKKLIFMFLAILLCGIVQAQTSEIILFSRFCKNLPTLKYSYSTTLSFFLILHLLLSSQVRGTAGAMSHHKACDS